MNEFVAWLYRKRKVVLIVMLISSLCNLLFLLGEWGVFWGVFLGQIWSGQCFYSYVAGREMIFSAGARVRKDADVYVRSGVAGLSLFIYVLLFFFKGY